MDDANLGAGSLGAGLGDLAGGRAGPGLGLLGARLVTMLEDHRHRRPRQLGRNGRRQLSLEWCHRRTRRQRR
jgi:hypothetical protein